MSNIEDDFEDFVEVHEANGAKAQPMVSRRSMIKAALGGVAGAAAVAPHARAAPKGDDPARLERPEDVAGTERIRNYIRRCREEALAELKPSTKQVERALDLHRQATVCDPMGGHSVQQGTKLWGLFSERMENYIRREMAKHADPDWPTVRPIVLQAARGRPAELARDPRMQKDLKALMQASGVTVGVTSTDPWRLEEIAFRTFVFDAVDHIEKVTSFEGVEELKRTGAFGAICHNHGMPVVEGLEGKEALETLYLLGIRWSLLTHGEGNQYGGGQRSDPSKGLTDLGREMVKRMNQLGIVVDTSHTSPQTALDMANTSEEPIVTSHTACRAVDHGYCAWRNMTDEGLKAIADTGGVVAICTHPSIVGGYSIEAGMKHIRHAVKLLGAAHLAVSSDRALFLQDLPPEVIDKAKPDNLVPYSRAGKYPGFWRWRQFQEAWKICAQASSLQPCAWPYNVTLPLVMEGYSDENIRKIIGENVVRVAGGVMRRNPTGEEFSVTASVG